MRFFILMLFSSSIWAGDWTPADTSRQALVTGLLIADWAQTRTIVRQQNTACVARIGEASPCPENKPTFHELNPLLGKHPSIGRVNNYFALSIVAHAGISYVLPPNWRQGWQYVWIGIETNTVYRNHSLGIRMSF